MNPKIRQAGRSLSQSSLEAFIAFLCVTAGVPILFATAALAPNSLLFILPLVIVKLWAGTMLAGGALKIVGILSSQLRIERAGAALVCASMTVITIAILAYAGLSAPLGVLTYFFFAVAMGARYRHLGKVIRAVEHAQDQSQRMTDRGD